MVKGKKIWITGATGGLGHELALNAAKQGAHVILLARDVEKLARIKSEIDQNGGNAQTFLFEVSDHATIAKRISEILEEVGGIDVLINNAGFGVFEAVNETSLETITEMFDVNVIGLIAITQSVLQTMMAQKSGHIINIASQAGKIATAKSSIYAATKHAVLGFTNALRLELDGTNINVSSVNPGPIKTPFFDRADESGSYVKSIEKWMLQPDEVAKLTIKLIDHPKRELNLPRLMALGTTVYPLMPGVFEKVLRKQFNQK